MSSLLPAESIAPDPTIVVAVCMACHHWQADCTPRARTELGGNQPALWALVELAAEHEAECVGAGGRVKVLGKWVERPMMSSERQATGVLGMYPLPAWWVWR